MRLFRICREVIENILDRGSDGLVASEQAQVRIKARRRGIVIPRAEMGIAANFAVRILAQDQCELGMRLQTYQAVKHLDAGILETPRPFDVRSFVETRLEFH